MTLADPQSGFKGDGHDTFEWRLSQSGVFYSTDNSFT